MEYRVDYHFHGNFSKSPKRAYKKANCLWKKLQESGINVLISTEHAYKDFKTAYQILQDTKPDNAYLFPGIEYITSEGIDIVIFSNKKTIYDYKELAPYLMTFEQTINFVKNHSDLRSYVTHPYTPGTTSVIRKLGLEVYHKAVNDLGAVEIANSALDATIVLLKKFIFLNNKMVEFNKVRELPIADYPKQINFLAAGSDSHHSQDVGTYLSIQSEEKDVFAIITSHSSSEVHYKQNNRWWHIIPSSITTLHEYLIKKINY